jgi:MoaA/NifB/PqqE/SkfB family radical SAM enzyme
MGDYRVVDRPNHKTLVSENVNYIFDKRDGFMAVFGKNGEDDPDFSPFGPFILDMEVTDICGGVNGIPCNFCYKSNTMNNMHNMSFDTFKNIFDKFKKINTLTQIAFGVDAMADSNPDLWTMAEYSRSNGIIPNVTVATISDRTADMLANVMGAVAVSRYEDKNYCYDSVQKLVSRGMRQVNIHMLIHAGNIDQIKETFQDYRGDGRLNGMNAIVLLSLKKKGRGAGFEGATQEQFKEIVDLAFQMEIPIGFDSCGCCKFLEAVKDSPNYKKLEMVSEKCESTLFSFYINAEGKGFPCSFCEGVGDWVDGIDMVASEDYLKDVWNEPRILKFREALLKNGRNCPIYKI